jgi:hypothetical protein
MPPPFDAARLRLCPATRPVASAPVAPNINRIARRRVIDAPLVTPRRKFMLLTSGHTPLTACRNRILPATLVARSMVWQGLNAASRQIPLSAVALCLEPRRIPVARERDVWYIHGIDLLAGRISRHVTSYEPASGL